MEFKKEVVCKRRTSVGFINPSSSNLAPRSNLLLIIILTISSALRAEPWIDTRDAFLRADIEMLADAGVISVPITTYPLMWSGIIKDIDNSKIDDVPAHFRAALWRVKSAGKLAFSKRGKQQVRLSFANGEQVLRAFGDESRAKTELAARRSGMSKKFSWNIEVSQVGDPADGENTRYDGSYLSMVVDNWIVAFGAIEKWWGPSWESNNLLSNNARPPLGVSLHKNYSDKSKIPIVSWLGPWSLSGFAAKLDDPRAIENAMLGGLSLSFKPHQSIEVGVRATALWGGKGIDDSLENLVDNIVGVESCIPLSDEQQALQTQTDELLECAEGYTYQGDRLAGIDFRWRLPLEQPISLYASAFGESESQPLPRKTISQLGLTSSLNFFNTNWKWFIEQSNTALDNDKFNLTYESAAYPTGYRFYQRAIGSTFDNDSQVSSAGIMANLTRQSSVNLTLSRVELNRDGENASEFGLHSVNGQSVKFNRLRLDWRFKTRTKGNFKVNLDYSDQVFDQWRRLEDKYRVGLDWTYVMVE